VISVVGALDVGEAAGGVFHASELLAAYFERP
jgi:hypothetical protein